MANPVTPKDSREIQDKLATWLEANLIDPYEQATGKTRSNFVKKDEYNLSGQPPILDVGIGTFNPNKIATQSKTAYLEEEEHSFIIYYYNQMDHRFTFSDNGLTLTNEAQCLKYLQYLRDTLKSNMTAFDGWFHKHTFGEIPKPVRHPKSSLWVSMLPFTVYTYRK